jgi:hypothetical protein
LLSQAQFEWVRGRLQGQPDNLSKVPDEEPVFRALDLLRPKDD